MIQTRLAMTAALSFAALSVLGGCAADAVPTEGDVSRSEDAMSTKKALLGKWDADTGIIYNLELTNDYAETLGGFLKGHRFEATVDNGVRCITVPCPASDVLSGVYAIKGDTITFASYDRAIASFANIAGEYRFRVTAKQLSMAKCGGSTAAPSTFHHAPPAATCGNVVCGEGTTCCNPLMSICVKPGMMCTL
jgi:hypothetical protein